MKNFIPWILGGLLLVLGGCLPQEKVTQCGDGEAFSPTQRRCVASLGSTGNIISIQSFTPAYPYTVYQNSSSSTVHNVTVRDPYNQGFRTRWSLTRPDNTTISLASNTLSYTLIPNSGFMNAIGSYTLVFTLLDVSGITPIDTRSWTIQVINIPTPEIKTTLPGSPVVTKMTNDPSSLNFQIGVENPSGTSTSILWYLDGVQVDSGVNSSQNFIHQTTITSLQVSAVKTYSLQAVIKSGSTTYDSHTWYITVTHPATPTITDKSPDTAIAITAVDGQNMTTSAFSNSVGVVNDFCVTVSDKAGSNGTGVDVKFFKDGAPFPISGTPANSAAIDNEEVCVSDIPADPSFTLVNPLVGEAHIFKARVFDKGTGVELTSDINPINWIISVRPKNEAPIARIDRSDISSLNDEVTCYTDSTYSTLNTIANGSSVNFCRVTQDSDTSFTFQVYDSDYPLDYATSISPLPDSTTNLDQFRVNYYLNGQLLDGTHPLSDSDCTFDYADGNVTTAGLSKFSCFINFRSYNSSGPISVAGLSYTVTAKVTDKTLWPIAGAPGVDSNLQTWQVTKVEESIVGAPQIGAQVSSSTGSPLLSTESALFISTDPVNILPATGTAIIQENQTLVFNLALGDLERDNGIITVTRCSEDPNSPPYNCSAAEPPVSASLTRNTGDEWARKNIPYTLKDNVVMGAASDIVYFQVSYLEINDSTPAPVALENMQVPVVNVNPSPLLQPPSGTLPDPSGTYVAFTGFPFTIDPGVITDSNQYDGNVIEYQWRYSSDGSTWHDIEGADKRLLVWTPPRNLGFNPLTPSVPANIQLQLCVGDNGFGNDITLGEEKCTLDEMVPYSWSVSVYNSAVSLAANDLSLVMTKPGVDKAIWIDEASNAPVSYTAYGTSNTVGTGGYIVVEKTILNQTSAQTGSVFTVTDASEAHSLIFKAYPSHADCRPWDISLTGHNDGTQTDLYLSYVCQDLDSKNKLNIRHIKVLNDKINMAHPGTFGFDYDGPTLGTELILNSNMTGFVSNQRTVISIASVVNGDTIQFNYTSNPLVITVGTDICNPLSNCNTTTKAATELRDFINNSSDLNLQGFTATSLTNQVTLEGTIADDYHIHDSQVRRAGKIQIAQLGGNFYWYVPYLNSQASSLDIHKISVLAGTVGDLNASDYSQIKNTLLTATTPSAEIDNDINTDDQSMIFAARDEYGEINVYQYQLTSAPPASLGLTLVGIAPNIFLGENVKDIKVAVNQPGNPHSIDVAARFTAGPHTGEVGVYHIGENSGTYDLFGTVPGSQLPLAVFGATQLESNYSGAPIALNDLADFQIQTTENANELLFFFSTTRTNSMRNEIFLGKITFDGMLNPILSCADDSYTICAPLSQYYQGPTTGPVRDTITLEGTPYFDKIAISKPKTLTMGDEGAIAGENTRQVIGVAYSVDNTGVGSADIENQILIQQNMINISDESITTKGPDYSGLPYVVPIP